MPQRLRHNVIFLTSLLLAVSMVVLAAFPAFSVLFDYERDLIKSGEFWRFFTGHFSHLNLNHALMNGAGFVLLGFFFNRDTSVRWWLSVIVLSALCISSYFFFVATQVAGYAGFSGVLHGLFVFGFVQLWNKDKLVSALGLVLIAGRLLWEQSGAYNADYLLDVINGSVIPEAHLFGALTGFSLGLLAQVNSRHTNA